MSRTSLQEKRLRFFRRGNTHCPICLTEFTEPDVRAGRVVTLEHAPQESLGGRPACLTCMQCNTGTSAAVMDQAVARHYQAVERGGYHITIRRDGQSVHTVSPEYCEFGEDKIRVRTPRDVVGKSRGPFTLRWTEPHPDAVLLGLLKSAYLMVFSLLGTAGYRYAQRQAVTSIREQLLSPAKERIRPLVVYADDNDNPSIPDHAMLMLTKYRCWAVKIHTEFVILPTGGSMDWRERIAGALELPMTLPTGSTVLWTAPTFRGSPVYGKKSDALTAKHVFGSSFRTPRRDYVIVYEEADMVAALPVSGPEASEP